MVRMSPKKATPSSATYVYCIVRAKRAPAPGRFQPPPGLGPPRALDAGGGLFLIVSDAPPDEYGEEALNARLEDMDWVSRCALAHEAIIESARSAESVVPMKLFTIFRDDGRARAMVEKDRRRLERVLDRVAGCAEYGVRLTLDERRARKDLVARAVKAASGASGAAFLQRKKNLKAAGEELVHSARAVADEVFTELAAKAGDSYRRTDVEGLVKGSRLLMDGVFLVPNRSARRFRSALEKTARSLAPRGYELVLNGPWPPYHFVADAA